jgi:hypothetical protein
MTNDELTATGRPLGALLQLRPICVICKCGESTMRGLIRDGLGPPLFKRPGSNRLLGYEGEVRDWLESNRRVTAPVKTAA